MKIRSIRAKFVLGFLLIFAVSFLLLNQTIVRIVQTSNQKIITEELIGLKKTGNGYVRQAYMINHYPTDAVYFGQLAQEIIGDLHYASSGSVAAYSADGKLLVSSESSAFSAAKEDDLKQAMRGSTAYTISYDGGTASVMYAFPVAIDGVTVGILRFAKHFDSLYEQSSKILNTIFYTALAIFAAAFLFSFLLSRHITIPLVKLAKASTEVMKGNLNVRLKMRRKDEIGRLTDNFNDMIARIGSQIERIERDRERLEKLNAQRKQFFDNVTHELKTPLTSILGYAELIRENGESDEQLFRKGMNHIVEESQRLHGMVVALLEASRKRDDAVWSETESVDIGRLLKDVCDAMSFKARRYGKAIRLHIEDGLWVRGQPDRLRQLLINLIDNAIKYGFANSEIEVNVRLDAAVVRAAIENRGETIAQDELDRIFAPFYSAEGTPKEEGSVGLGLHIAQEIAESFGGSIAIRSENERTTVVVELPYWKAERWT